MSGVDWRSGAQLLDAAGKRVGERPDVAWWGMVLFLFNEAALFASLIGTYFYLSMSSVSWPPPGVERPTLPEPLIMTAALLSSSAVLVYGERGLERGDRRRYYVGVVGAVLLGLAFLGLQTKEYIDKLKSIGPTQNSYGSIFYTITGLHGTHVAFGLLFLLWALARQRKSRSTVRTTGVGNASLYWHFVDGVWLVILTSLYLSPRWT
ncbi:MAG TPA: heme-copper oxidase subunit III [Gemmatimonadaceae bacterium]